MITDHAFCPCFCRNAFTVTTKNTGNAEITAKIIEIPGNIQASITGIILKC